MARPFDSRLQQPYTEAKRAYSCNGRQMEALNLLSKPLSSLLCA